MAASRVRISVTEPTVHSELMTKPFATYKICAEEGTARWVRVTRWSEVRRLYEQMPAPPDRSTPAFSAHSFRFGAAHVSNEIIAARRAELEAMLNTWADAFDLSIVDGRGPDVLCRFLTEEMADSGSNLGEGSTGSQGVDDEMTRDECWYTPERGWPEAVLSTTRNLVPPAVEEPVLAMRPRDAVGTLSVEVLQATGLKCVDTTLTQNDIFALIVFEGHALRTATRWDENQPVWPVESARAARLPVLAPFSDLHLALMHEGTPAGRATRTGTKGASR
eukprot:7143295-Prymnesium_polylepis.1